MKGLEELVGLSHEFGTADYVKGGGGNASFKDATTMWIKPSGTTLGELDTESFVALSRARIQDLYEATTPEEPAAREELVKNLMAAAMVGGAGRASVEAPLHNVFNAAFVVHTHPPLVNGMTCAKNGAETCARLFPDALWVEYVDPGYTLCMALLERIRAFRAENGREPSLLIMQNHGIFAAADTADEMRALYGRVMETLAVVYGDAGISAELAFGDAPEDPDTVATIQALFGDAATFVTSSAMFSYPPGPVSPDHLVYARAFPFTADLTPEAAAGYEAEHGYMPKVVVAGERIYGLGTSGKNADLALELAGDGAQVVQLAQAFGGIEYMTDRARIFIENWEVESYRQQQVG